MRGGGGGGGGEGDTTLLNNCGATQVKNSKVSLEGTAILFVSMEEIHFKMKSTRTLSNFDFQRTKILYQSYLKHIAFFFTFFKG